jgi:hypothetical protein
MLKLLVQPAMLPRITFELGEPVRREQVLRRVSWPTLVPFRRDFLTLRVTQGHNNS